MAIIGSKQRNLNLEQFDKELSRKININYYKSSKDINKYLLNNILNGIILKEIDNTPWKNNNNLREFIIPQISDSNSNIEIDNFLIYERVLSDPEIYADCRDSGICS